MLKRKWGSASVWALVAMMGLTCSGCSRHTSSGAAGTTPVPVCSELKPTAISRPGVPDRKVPPVANIAGIVVGVDTIGTIERRLGAGEAMVGGHPNGARVWRVGDAGWVLYVDGFEYRDEDYSSVNNEVAEEVRLEKDNPCLLGKPLPPKLRLSRVNKGYWRTLPLGTSERDTLKWLAARKLQPKRDDDTITVEQPGLLRVNKRILYESWQASLTFERKRLVEIYVSCE